MCISKGILIDINQTLTKFSFSDIRCDNRFLYFGFFYDYAKSNKQKSACRTKDRLNLQKKTIVKKTVIATRDGTARKSKSFILIYKSGSLNGGTKSIRIPLRTKECLSSFLSIVLLSMNGKKREPEFHCCGLSDTV